MFSFEYYTYNINAASIIHLDFSFVHTFLQVCPIEYNESFEWTCLGS